MAFRLVLADAIAQQGGKALIDGRTLREVSTLMSKGLKALPLEDMAYGVGAFMATVQAYGKHQLKHLIDPSFSPLNKERFVSLASASTSTWHPPNNGTS